MTDATTAITTGGLGNNINLSTHRAVSQALWGDNYTFSKIFVKSITEKIARLDSWVLNLVPDPA